MIVHILRLAAVSRAILEVRGLPLEAVLDEGQLCGQQLLQMTSQELPRKSEVKDPLALTKVTEGQSSSSNSTIASTHKDGSNTELQFIHIPCTFGHTVEEEGMKSTMKWGEFIPELDSLSGVTGCNFFYTPMKYWPSSLRQSFAANRTLFAMLRDPYDRMANEFRMQVGGVDSVYTLTLRKDVSKREGHMERESAEYQRFYKECDVNGYLQSELKKYLAGDRFRGNCHLLPSAEYFDVGHGIVVEPIDERRIPDSFNDFMEKHHAAPRMDVGSSIHNIWCNDISAYSLNEETKEFIRKVYADDFQLTCKYFGYCDNKQMYCHENIPDMCGSKPK